MNGIDYGYWLRYDNNIYGISKNDASSRPREPFVRRHSCPRINNTHGEYRMILLIMINMCEYLSSVSKSVLITDGLDDVPSTHSTFGLGNVNSTVWISALRGGITIQ